MTLRRGCDDYSFALLFESVSNRCFETFRPSVIWIQCRANSLRNDITGRFHLSTKTHGRAVETVLKRKVPTVPVGGYTIQNVSRCWAYEASLAGNVELPKSLYSYDYSRPDKDLHFVVRHFCYSPKDPEWRPSEEGRKSYMNYLDKGGIEQIQEATFRNMKELSTMSYGT